MLSAITLCAFALHAAPVRADSVNSPNITLNVDTNRSTGNGAGNVSLTINTITIAETMLPEYTSGDGRVISLTVRPGFQFDSTSNVTCQSATIGFNGGAVNAVATLTPTGAANEQLSFNLTTGTNAAVQDIIRISGIKLKILNALGAAGPAQTTMNITTSAAGGAFTDQGIVAANIQKGTADHLVFAVQPGTVQSGADILPAVSLVDFGGNIITNDDRQITLTIQNNPGAAALNGITAQSTLNGLATWVDDDNMNIATAGAGYTLRATNNGESLQTSDFVISGEFDVLVGPPNRLAISTQPVSTDAGSPILITISILDNLDNLVTGTPVEVTLDSAINPGGWPLLADSSLTKTTVDGVATWEAADNLRINKATAAYKLRASGVGDPLETDPFNITPGAPTQTAMTMQPVSSMVGDNLLITVSLLDGFNNLNTTTPSDVTLFLTTNPGNTTLAVASSLTKTTTDGVAMWTADDQLRINAAGVGYQILAAGVGIANESDPFDITAPDDGMGGMGGMGGMDMDACGADCGAGAMMAVAPLWLLRRGRMRRTARPPQR